MNLNRSHRALAEEVGATCPTDGERAGKVRSRKAKIEKMGAREAGGMSNNPIPTAKLFVLTRFRQFVRKVKIVSEENSFCWRSLVVESTTRA